MLSQDIFIGELNIIINTNCTDAYLQSFIDKYEPEILINIFGIEFYNELVAAMNVNPIASKWSILWNGGTYVVGGVNYPLRGLKYVVASYVYYWYHRENAFNVDQTGASLPKLDNAYNQSMNFKMMSRWNEAVDMTGTKLNPKWGTISHYLLNGEFENYKINTYKGGKIRGLQWLQ